MSLRAILQSCLSLTDLVLGQHIYQEMRKGRNPEARKPGQRGRDKEAAGGREVRADGTTGRRGAAAVVKSKRRGCGKWAGKDRESKAGERLEGGGRGKM